MRLLSRPQLAGRGRFVLGCRDSAGRLINRRLHSLSSRLTPPRKRKIFMTWTISQLAD